MEVCRLHVLKEDVSLSRCGFRLHSLIESTNIYCVIVPGAILGAGDGSEQNQSPVITDLIPQLEVKDNKQTKSKNTV